MWLITARGYLSLRATDDPETVLVLARRPGHIEAYIPGAQVTTRRTGYNTPDGPDDYRYRALVPRGHIAEAMQRSLVELPAGSFRESITDVHYYDALSRARKDLHATQDKSRYAFLNRPEFQDPDKATDSS